MAETRYDCPHQPICPYSGMFTHGLLHSFNKSHSGDSGAIQCEGFVRHRSGVVAQLVCFGEKRYRPNKVPPDSF